MHARARAHTHSRTHNLCTTAPRTQVCLNTDQKEALGLAGHLRTTAAMLVKLMRSRHALDSALLAARELSLDDSNMVGPGPGFGVNIP